MNFIDFQSDGGRTTQLEMLNVCVVDLNYCQRIHGSSITDHHVCTLNIFGEGACNGDSGSPVAFNNEQIGIVSMSPKKCANGKPDIDTNVPALKKWISKTTGIKF